MSAEENLIPINVWLAGRSYRIRIKPEEEEAVRKSVKIADDKIAEFRSYYAGKDDQDFLAMCLLMYAVDNTSESFQNPVIQNELLQMIEKIDKALED
jgi:cell division protein ZapA